MSKQNLNTGNGDNWKFVKQERHRLQKLNPQAEGQGRTRKTGEPSSTPHEEIDSALRAKP